MGSSIDTLLVIEKPDMQAILSADAALSDSLERYRLLVESIPALVWVWDATGRPVLYNRRWFEYTGLTPADYAVDHWRDLLHPDDASAAIAAWERCKANGEPYAFEYRLRRADGAYRWFLSRKTAYLGPHGIEQWVGICTDIDDRKRAEGELLSSERRFRELADAIPQIVWVAAPHGGLTHLNAKATDYTGIGIDELTGWSWDRVIHPDDLAGTVGEWTATIRDGIPRDMEFRIRRSDGAYRWHITRQVPTRNAEGEIVEWYGTCTDVEDLKRSSKTLSLSEARKTAILDTARDAIITMDHEGIVVECNTSAERIFGYGRGEFVGKELSGLIFSPSHRELHRAGLARYLATGEGRIFDQRLEMPAMRSGGTVFPVELAVTRIPTDGPPLFTAYLRDITERKRAEGLLAAQHAIVDTLARSQNLGEAASGLLRAVCENLGWNVGDLWVLDPQENVLAYVDLWSVEGVDAAELLDMARHRTFAYGACFPGSIWAAGKPLWLADLATTPNFSRGAAASRAGLRVGVGFPIQFGGNVVGVAEFFSRDSRPPDAEQLGVFENLGSQIGQFIERKRSEEKLHLFRALIDQTTDGIEVIDPETGRFLDVNEKACAAHGYTREEFLKLRVSDIDPIVASQTWDGMVAEGLLSGFQIFESIHLRKDGSTFPVEVSHNSIRLDREYMVAVVRDITDRKRVEEALLLRERAIAAATQGIIITDADGVDNPIVYVSPGFERMTGYGAAEALGRNCRFLQGKETDSAATAQLREAIRTGQSCTVELLNYRKDGTTFWNELSITPVRNAASHDAHFVGIQTDVTHRRRLEEQFRQVQKMEGIGQLAGGIAHDFNNLLTIINGYSELLLERLPTTDPSRDLIAEIHKAGERSAGLTRQLLAFSRQQVLSPQVLSLNALLDSTEKMLRRLIGEDVLLAAALQPDLWDVRTDPGQIEQVLMNLSINARDAMPRGGRLTIETRNVVLDEAYTQNHVDARPGKYVMLSVSDSGSGIPPEVKARIFEPFFTTKAPGKGTGLGLATAYGIVRQSGGHMAVYSEVGVGTSFKIYLPRVEEMLAESKFRSAIVRPPRGCETILLAEDEESVRALIRRVLTGCGYDVLDAADGAQAVRLATGHAGPILLLITDVVMPGAGGRAVAQEVSQLHPEARVLFVSGYTDDAVIRHGVLREGVNFLQKPFSPLALAMKVREALDAPAPTPIE